MGLTSAYLVTTKNLEAFLNALVSAQAPETFTNRFLSALDFKSTNDRLFIGVLKGLGLLDDSGKPTTRYFDFIDQTQMKRVLATGIREAYEDLFRLNKNAHTMAEDEVKGKFRTLTQGQKSDKVLSLMTNTFKALCDLADWSVTSQPPLKDPIPAAELEKKTADNKKAKPIDNGDLNRNGGLSLNYDIRIHLPETRDVAVYEAIFKAMRENLLG